MKKILFAVLPILCFTVFFISKPIDVSAAPAIEDFKYQYDMNDFLGQNYSIGNISGFFDNNKACYDSSTKIVYTDYAYCVSVILETYLYQPTQKETMMIFFSNSPVSFGSSIFPKGQYDSFSFDYIASGFDGFAFGTNSYEGNILTTKSIVTASGWNYSMIGIMYIGQKTNPMGEIYSYVRVKDIQFANYEINDFKPPVNYGDLSVTYEFRENIMAAPNNRYQHVFTVTARQDMYISFTAYDTPIDNNLTLYRDNRIFKYSGVMETTREGTSNINMKTAEAMVRGEIEFHINEYDNAQTWFEEDYFPRVKAAYNSYVSTLGFFDKLTKDGIYEWAYKTDYAYPYQTVTTYYTDKFLTPYFKLTKNSTKQFIIPAGALKTLIGHEYYWAVVFGQKTGMDSDFREVDCVDSSVSNGPFLKVFNWTSPADSNGSASITNGLDKNDFYVPVTEDGKGQIVWNGNGVNGSPNGKSPLDYQVDDFNQAVENGVLEGFDISGSLKNIGSSMTGFFGMMAGFFSFVPAIIWGLLATLLTLCIALRILGR